MSATKQQNTRGWQTLATTVAKKKPYRQKGKNGKKRARSWRALVSRHKGKCFWCGSPVHENLREAHPRKATIDHLHEKDHPHRKKPCHTGEVRRVLACFECNNDRSRLGKEIRFWMADQALWYMQRYRYDP